MLAQASHSPEPGGAEEAFGHRSQTRGLLVRGPVRSHELGSAPPLAGPLQPGLRCGPRTAAICLQPRKRAEPHQTPLFIAPTPRGPQVRPRGARPAGTRGDAHLRSLPPAGPRAAAATPEAAAAAPGGGPEPGPSPPRPAPAALTPAAASPPCSWPRLPARPPAQRRRRGGRAPAASTAASSEAPARRRRRRPGSPQLRSWPRPPARCR